jgi:hypothetical protein
LRDGFADDAVGHWNNGGTDQARDLAVVGGHHQRRRPSAIVPGTLALSRGETIEKIQRVVSGLWIKGTGRLVGHDQVGLGQRHEGEDNALGLSPRQLRRTSMGDSGRLKPDVLEDLGHIGPRTSGHRDQLLADGVQRMERIVGPLGNHPDP